MMKKSPISPRQALRRMAIFVEELNPPTPFTFEGFRTWLEGHCDRRVLLIGTPMPPGAPSGVWLRTGTADYLHYEERTSPFHQAHIIATLAAHLLLAAQEGGGVSRRLVAALKLQSGGSFHGIDIGDTVSRPEAEAFAFEVLRRSGKFPGAFESRKLLRRLQPLRTALLAAVPSAAADIGAGTSAGTTSRLYRSAIEIRDAALALELSGTWGMATSSGHEAGMQPTALSPSASAGARFPACGPAALDFCLRGGQFENSPATGAPADLRAEALTLIRASEALIFFAEANIERPRG